MKELQDRGHKLILWTVRSTDTLREAVDYCEEKGIEFLGINENPTQKFWSGSPKAYAQLFIDDAALGCPLIYSEGERRPYADWTEIRKMLKALSML
ncbi:unnamed protein product [marine sediment metagenome]|uniref:Uncharacterized protein n=1 Tax=marine sediment metagenome TaxID=412755 RepID=X0RSK6_9ZZZZ